MDLLIPREIYLSTAFYHSSPIARYVLPTFIVFEVYERGVERSLIHYSLHKDVYVVTHITARYRSRIKQILSHAAHRNVSPEELEEKLYQAEGMLDAISPINLKLSSFKQIGDIVLRETEFEKTATRKIKRYKLKGRVRFFNSPSVESNRCL